MTDWEALALATLPFVRIARHVDSSRSYGGTAWACDSCDEINGNHDDDCADMIMLNAVNVVLRRLKMKTISENDNPYEIDEFDDEIND